MQFYVLFDDKRGLRRLTEDLKMKLWAIGVAFFVGGVFFRTFWEVMQR